MVPSIDAVIHAASARGAGARGRRLLAAGLGVALVALGLFGSNAAAGTGVRISDPDTTFHRLYVIGKGQQQPKFHEEDAFRRDADLLAGALERDGETQAPGSDAGALEQPTEQELRDAISTLQEIAQPGEEVTIMFIGHGAGGPKGLKDDTGEANEPRDEAFWLNDANGTNKPDTPEEFLTDDEFAEMITGEKGFRESVTLLVLLDTCYGGGFTGGSTDLAETDHVQVLGASNECPMDSGGEEDSWVRTLAEEVVRGVSGERADADGDGCVTATELRNWLRNEEFWPIGPPDDTTKRRIKEGNSRCRPYGGGDCGVPDLRLGRLSIPGGGRVRISGRGFDGGERLRLGILRGNDRDLIGRDRIPSSGRFRGRLAVPDVRPDDYLLFARDSGGRSDWEIIRIR